MKIQKSVDLNALQTPNPGSGMRGDGLGLVETDTCKDSVPLGRDVRIYSKVFAVSGTLSALTHEEIRRALESRGGILSRRISRKTDYLVLGRKAGSVAVTAQIYAIPILNENEFLKLLGISRQFCLDL